MPSKNNILTKTEYVYLAIKEAILSGEYAYDEKIVIRNISEKLNVSDIPVREAMRRLEAEKLVSIIPHVGVVVNSFSIKEIEEGVEIREVLESWAARLVVNNIAQDDIGMLKSLVSQMDKCIEDENYQLYGRLNREFHQALYECSGNDTLVKMISELWDKTERSRAVFKINPSRMKQSNDEHKKLLEALAKGDADQAEQLIKDQRSRTTKRFLAHLKNTVGSKEANKDK